MKHIKLFEENKKSKSKKDSGNPKKVKDFNEFSTPTNKVKEKEKKKKEVEEQEEHAKQQEIIKSSGGNA